MCVGLSYAPSYFLTYFSFYGSDLTNSALVNYQRTARVADLLSDFRDLQLYIADMPVDPENQDDYYTEGWAALRQCYIDGQHILNCAAETRVPRVRGGPEEQEKAELQQYVYACSPTGHDANNSKSVVGCIFSPSWGAEDLPPTACCSTLGGVESRCSSRAETACRTYGASCRMWSTVASCKLIHNNLMIPCFRLLQEARMSESVRYCSLYLVAFGCTVSGLSMSSSLTSLTVMSDTKADVVIPKIRQTHLFVD